MSKCIYCGTELTDGALYCGGCGKKQEMSQEESVEKTAERILSTALEHGGRDNTTLILLEASGEQKKQGFGGFLRNLFGRRKTE